MKKKTTTKPQANRERTQNKEAKEGYPLYPPKDDIYRRYKEEQDLDPENLLRSKEENDEFEETVSDVRELNDDLMGIDLDVPGAELDDEQEDIGNEDEENNYYSIGGDKHHDLEEDREDEEDII